METTRYGTVLQMGAVIGILGSVSGVVCILMLIGILDKTLDQLKHKIICISCGLVCANLWTWLGIAIAADFPYVEEEYPIQWIELDNGTKYQYSPIGLSEGINITEECGVVVPEGSIVRIHRYTSHCVKGVWFCDADDFRFFVVMGNDPSKVWERPK